MSDIAADKPGIQLFVSEHAGVWPRFKWLLPILITVVVTMAPLVHYWGFLNTEGAQYIPVGFAIMLAVFLSALPAVICFVQNVSRRRQLSKLNDLNTLPVATTTHFQTAVKAIDSVRLVVDTNYALPIFAFFITLFIGFLATSPPIADHHYLKLRVCCSAVCKARPTSLDFPAFFRTPMTARPDQRT
jgi:hypothetical protein